MTRLPGLKDGRLRDLRPLRHGALAQALEALNGDGAETRVVGGAVRDLALGVKGDDLDLATTARPDEVIRRARAAGFKVATTGITHGTVTLMVPRSRTRMKSLISTSSLTRSYSASEIRSRVPASLLAASTRLATLTASPIAVSRSCPGDPIEPITASPKCRPMRILKSIPYIDAKKGFIRSTAASVCGAAFTERIGASGCPSTPNIAIRPSPTNLSI